MVFSSLLFLFFFLPLFLLGYHVTDKKYKNNFALLFSLIFYCWGAPNFIGIAILSIIVDFYLVKKMASCEQARKKLVMWLSVSFNLSFLLYYKYYNFFLENVNSFLGEGNAYQISTIVLPIGISFFTFQKISYTLDIYRKTTAPLKSLVQYALYIMLFPQLIAGPIVRFSEIANQLKNRDSSNYDDKIYGFYRFAIGLGKKVLIANVLGEKADLIFGLEAIDLSASAAWLGIICYTFQIYFDFSGYSDMAIGLGYLMGFKFPENFKSPYISQSITEFWKRWHITLGSWMRDYLYIPLGGNRVKSKLRLYLNLWVVFLISGLWHGASWNFVLWGAFHGIFLVFDRLFLNNLTQYIGKPGRILLTFFIVVLSWVLFRAENLTYAVDFYSSLFSFEFASLHLFTNDKLYRVLFLAFLLSFFFVFKKPQEKYTQFNNSSTLTTSIVKISLSILLIILSVGSISSSGFNPFIYFRF